MYKEHSVGVVVPAYNEEKLIGTTLSTMPDFVDQIIVVNDGSKDGTLERIQSFQEKDSRIVLVNHEQNKGLGQSLIDGYLKARELECQVTAVMAGDAQMSPEDLPRILDPIVEGVADYSKGNRLLHDKVIERMPTHRFLGNSALTLLTKFATGYWHSMDPQCGYTAISLSALEAIPIERMIKGYGYNAHILYMLNVNNFTVSDVGIEPVYGEEQSKIKLANYIPTVSKLLLKLFFKRIIRKYLLRDFHPLVLFYALSFSLLTFVCLPLSVRFFYMYCQYSELPRTTFIVFSFAATNALFSLFFGMWLDMEDNKRWWGTKK